MSKQSLRSKELFLKFQEEAQATDPMPLPPYLVHDVYMSFVGVRFDNDAVKRLLPPELTPFDSNTGTICVYSVGSGWGIAPFTACFAAIEVQGYDAPDGSPGYYIATGYYSGRGFTMMSGSYNQNALKGGSRHFQDGDFAVGVGGPEGIDALTMRTRPAKQRPPSGSGVHHYLGRRPNGGTNLFAIAFTGVIAEADPISVEIAESASERMKLARPVELLYALECTDFSVSFGPPRSITESAAELAGEAAKASLLSAFSWIGRPAILAGLGGEVILMNPEAETLLGDGLTERGGRLLTSRPGDQTALERIIATAIDRGLGQFDLEPIAFDRIEGRPLIAQAMPVDREVVGRPAAMILLSDPSDDHDSDIGPALQLLGLTPSEARMAALVGTGRSPKEAAERLEVTEQTARTYLKIIYDKLAIAKQTELARIVTRLESLGT